MLNKKNITELTQRDLRNKGIYTTDKPLFANHAVGSDCYPYEIIEILSERRIVVRAMNAEPDKDNGYDFYSRQVWKFASDERSQPFIVTKRKCGYWYKQGDGRYCPFFLSNEPHKRYDPHF